MMTDDCCSRTGDTIAQLGRKADRRRVLVVVMAIDFVMFAVEFGGSVLARSAARSADWIDMPGDAVVPALNRGPRREAGAALAEGGIILAFGIAAGGIVALLFLRPAWRVLADAIPAWRVAPELLR